MTLRVSQGDAKFAVAAEGNLRLSQGVAKFAVDTGNAASLRVSQGLVKFAVRTYPIVEIAKTFPPTNITVSKAPYVMWRARQR